MAITIVKPEDLQDYVGKELGAPGAITGPNEFIINI